MEQKSHKTQHRQLYDVKICKEKDFGMEKLLPLHICYSEVGKSFLVLE